jgi:6-phosphofructokinase 1
MRKIAVLTSGGDAPGMNAAIRSVTRSAMGAGWEVYGVRRGYAGLMENDIEKFTARSVGGIIQQGGTILGSARSEAFKTEEGRRKAIDNMQALGIDGLVVIGGNGSQTGAYTLSQMGFQVVGVASTIDNDLIGSDITIGVDTALNIALEAIDRLKITASSHKRAFLIEVMGRNCGYLALMAGIAGGAEVVSIPEIETTPEQIAQMIIAAYQVGKSHAIVVVAEGAKYDADALVTYFKENKNAIGFDLRATTLGHVQRGGAPTAYDRILGTRLGYGAIEALKQGLTGVLTGMIQSKLTYTPLEKCVGVTKSIDPILFEMSNALNR